jgi:mRNA interferase MazF
MNARLSTATVMPMTTGSRPVPWRIPIRFQDKDGLALGDQMRTLDQARLVKRMGRADAAMIAASLAMLREMFAE